MFNEIVRRLNGHGEDPQSLDEALKQLASEKAAAAAALNDLHARRRQALLDDASDSALDKLEREIARGETRIEKLTIAEPSLRARLSAAQVAANQRAEDAAASAYLDLAERAAKALEACDVAFIALRLAWNINERRLRRRVEPFAYAGIMVEGHGVQWAIATRRRIAEARAARERRDTPQPAPPPAKAEKQIAPALRPRLPHEPQRMTDSQHGVSLADGWDSIRERMPGIPDDDAALEPGQSRVVTIRPGMQDANGKLCRAGQRLRMSTAGAEAAARNGAVEIIESYAGNPEAPAGAE